MSDTKQKTFIVRLDEQTYKRLVAMSNKNTRPYGWQVKVLVDDAWQNEQGTTKK